MSAALPPIDNAFLPADVRNGTKERRQQYDAALSFERQLVGGQEGVVDRGQCGAHQRLIPLAISAARSCAWIAFDAIS